MFYFTEDPWITNGGTANHDTIYAIAGFIFKRLLRTINIAVSKNWNVNAWVVLHLGDQSPVCLSLIQLASCTAMYRQRLYANILESLCNFFNIFCAVVPAQSCFYCYRQF